MKPRLLDLFCGAGGATKGYQEAGFYVVGVDIKPQPHYCGDEFAQLDALQVLNEQTWVVMPGEFDAIHASPPCQAFTQMSARYRGKGGPTDDHPDLLTPTLALARGIDLPWVVENVVGAHGPMRTTFVLHGGMFGLGVHRPRRFESNILIGSPKVTQCVKPIGVYGARPDGRTVYRYRNNGNYKGKSLIRAAKSIEEARRVMGIDWMDWDEITQAIPPAYTEHIGSYLLAHLEAEVPPA